MCLIRVWLFLAGSVFAWRDPRPAQPADAHRRVVFLIAAHDEERVIGRSTSSAADQDYPGDRVVVHLVADRCSDATVANAHPDVVVHERQEGAASKGAALAWLVDRVEIEEDDIVAVVDADNLVDRGFARAVNDTFAAGATVVQARIEPSNPDESKVALAAALWQWMSNRLIDAPRANLRIDNMVHGTGFAVAGSDVGMLTSGADGLTEDQDLADRLAVMGRRVHWIPSACVADEKPGSAEVLVRQRARWVAGRRIGRMHRIAFLVRGQGRWSVARLDRLVHLVLPGRIIAFSILVIVTGLGFLRPEWLFISPWVPAISLLAAAVVIVVALAREGAGARRIVQVPLLLLFAAYWIPERLTARRQKGWYHTPHGGGVDDR